MQKFKELWQEVFVDGEKKVAQLISTLTADGFVEVTEAIEILKVVGKYEVGLSEANDMFKKLFKETIPTDSEGAE